MTPPPKAAGGVEVPAPVSRSELERVRRELDDQARALLSLERRLFDLTQSVNELAVTVEDGQRPSRIDGDFEARVLAAIERQRLTSSPPDEHTAEIKGRDWRVRAPWWVAIILAVVALAIVAVWRAEDLAKILAGK